jgi:transposase InsO family protein
MSRKTFIKTLQSRSESGAAALEVIKKDKRRTQASLVYLRNVRAKDYQAKVLQDFLREEGISHEVTEKYCPQSNGLAERLNFTTMDKFRCMLIDANFGSQALPSFCPRYPQELHIFGSICYALQPSQLLHKLEERLAKNSFLELILLATKFWTYRAKLLIWAYREEEPTHSSSLDPTPVRLEDSRKLSQGSRKRRSTSDLTRARIAQLQELGLTATVKTPWTTSVNLKDLRNRANLKLAWIQ